MSTHIKVPPLKAIRMLNRAVKEGVALLNESRADYLKSQVRWASWALTVRSVLGVVFVQGERRWQLFQDLPPKLKLRAPGIDPEYLDFARTMRRRLKVLIGYISEIEKSTEPQVKSAT